jgi:hypothetical protein
MASEEQTIRAARLHAPDSVLDLDDVDLALRRLRDRDVTGKLALNLEER